jgi:hypothetical protein
LCKSRTRRRTETESRIKHRQHLKQSLGQVENLIEIKGQLLRQRSWGFSKAVTRRERAWSREPADFCTALEPAAAKIGGHEQQAVINVDLC